MPAPPRTRTTTRTPQFPPAPAVAPTPRDPHLTHLLTPLHDLLRAATPLHTLHRDTSTLHRTLPAPPAHPPTRLPHLTTLLATILAAPSATSPPTLYLNLTRLLAFGRLAERRRPITPHTLLHASLQLLLDLEFAGCVLRCEGACAACASAGGRWVMTREQWERRLRDVQRRVCSLSEWACVNVWEVVGGRILTAARGSGGGAVGGEVEGSGLWGMWEGVERVLEEAAGVGGGEGVRGVLAHA